MGDDWFRRYHQAAPDAVPLLCLPHAGGSAGSWFGLSAELAPDVEVVAVQYPGRQDRRHEPVVDDLLRLADLVAARARSLTGRPLALLGHSMGATLAFEVARRLDRQERPLRRLFVSGRGAPALPLSEEVRLLDDDGLLAKMARLGTAHPRLLERPDVRRDVLRVVRGDYHAIETYSWPPGPPLPCPVTAFTGDADPVVDVPDVAAWAAYGGDFDLHVMSGGHFFVAEHVAAVAAVIRDHLTAGVPS